MTDPNGYGKLSGYLILAARQAAQLARPGGVRLPDDPIPRYTLLVDSDEWSKEYEYEADAIADAERLMDGSRHVPRIVEVVRSVRRWERDADGTMIEVGERVEQGEPA